MVNYNVLRTVSIDTLLKPVLKVFRLTFFVGATLLLYTPLLAQTGSRYLNDFTVQNEKLSDVIIQLSVQSGINFSFDANDVVMNNRISYHAEKKTVIQILDAILTPVHRIYKQIGNQIVVYKPKELLSKKEKTLPALPIPASSIHPLGEKKTRHAGGNKKRTLPPETIVPPVFQLDTLFYVDTLLLHDTLVQYDTITRVDTIFIRKDKVKPRKIKDFPVDYFQQKESREKGWSGDIFYAPLLTHFTFTDEKNPISLRNFTLGASASQLNKSWDFSFGFQLSHFANRFNHTQTVTQGGFFLADTIDTYYTVIASDTNWYYITDSTWQPLQSYQSNYDRTNQVGYFEVNIAAAYVLFSNKKIRLYAKVGGQMSIPLYQKGMAVTNSGEQGMTDLNRLNFGSPLFSALAGVGAKYRLNRSFDFRVELYYVNYFQSMVQGFPVHNKPDALGIKMGLIYYFR